MADNCTEYEANAAVSTASIEGAASTLRLLAAEAQIPSEQYGAYLGMAERLDRIAEARQSDDDSATAVIPIPPEAMDADAAHTVARHIYGE